MDLMKRKNKTFKVLFTLMAISGVAVASVDYQEYHNPKNEIIVGNDLGSFKPPASHESLLDKLKGLLKQA
jgi:hypothetical protein